MKKVLTFITLTALIAFLTGCSGVFFNPEGQSSGKDATQQGSHSVVEELIEINGNAFCPEKTSGSKTKEAYANSYPGLYDFSQGKAYNVIVQAVSTDNSRTVTCSNDDIQIAEDNENLSFKLMLPLGKSWNITVTVMGSDESDPTNYIYKGSSKTDVIGADYNKQISVPLELNINYGEGYVNLPIYCEGEAYYLSDSDITIEAKRKKTDGTYDAAVSSELLSFRGAYYYGDGYAHIMTDSTPIPSGEYALTITIAPTNGFTVDEELCEGPIIINEVFTVTHEQTTDTWDNLSYESTLEPAQDVLSITKDRLKMSLRLAKMPVLYISPEGNYSNDGSYGKPFDSISTALGIINTYGNAGTIYRIRLLNDVTSNYPYKNNPSSKRQVILESYGSSHTLDCNELEFITIGENLDLTLQNIRITNGVSEQTGVIYLNGGKLTVTGNTKVSAIEGNFIYAYDGDLIFKGQYNFDSDVTGVFVTKNFLSEGNLITLGSTEPVDGKIPAVNIASEKWPSLEDEGFRFQMFQPEEGYTLKSLNTYFPMPNAMSKGAILHDNGYIYYVPDLDFLTSDETSEIVTTTDFTITSERLGKSAFYFIEDAETTGNINFSKMTGNDISLNAANSDKPVTIKATSTGTSEDNITVNLSSSTESFLTINEGITLSLYSASGNNINVKKGTLILNGGEIVRSDVASDTAQKGSAVYIDSADGVFQMEYGEIRGFKSSHDGAGVYIERGSFSMYGGTICNNEASSSGGGIYSKDSKLTIEGGTIEGNKAVDGAGLYFLGQPDNCDGIHITGGTITKNIASRMGGGIYAGGIALKLTGGEITENEAGQGGGITINSNYNTVIGSIGGTGPTISKNTANGQGGGIYNGSKGSAITMDILSGTISENTSTSDGGGIFCWASTFNLGRDNGDGTYSGSAVISKNSAKSGGGISINGGNSADYVGTLNVYSGTIGGDADEDGNKATTSSGDGVYKRGGGGIYVYEGAILNIKGGTVSHNKSNSNGGGICIESHRPSTIDAGTISYNNATSGGGIYFKLTSKSLTLAGGTVSNNTATYGGGAYCWQGEFNIAGGSISSNSSGNIGGGIYNNNGTINISGGTVGSNTAVGNGGGISSNATGTINVTGGTISGNTASTNKGGIYSEGTLNINGGTFANSLLWSKSTSSFQGKYTFTESEFKQQTSGTIKLGTIDTDSSKVSVKLDGTLSDTMSLFEPLEEGGTLPANLTEKFTVSNEGYLLLSTGTVIKGTLPEGVTADQIITQESMAASDLLSMAETKGAVYLNGDISLTGETGDFTVTDGKTVAINALKASKITLPDDFSMTVSGEGSSLTVGANVTVTGTSSSGLIRAVEEGTFNLNGGTITGNTSGRGIYSTGTVNMTGGTIKDGNGGIQIEGGSLTITGGEISGHQSDDGAAISQTLGVWDQISVKLTGVTISDCTATSNGGAILINNGKLSVDGTTTFTDCEAIGGSGGAIFVSDGKLDFKNGTISNCSSSGSGGAIFIRNSAEATIENGEISECNSMNGGAIGIEQSAKLTISGGTIKNNTSTSDGGAIYINDEADGALIAITGGQISGNKALDGGDGGGIAVYGKGELRMEGGKISGNSGRYGGGIHLRNPDAVITIYGGEISGNTGEQGGGIAVLSGTLNITEKSGTTPVVISGNTAVSDKDYFGQGGGIILSETTSTPKELCKATIEAGTIKGNTARQGGGIYSDSCRDSTNSLYEQSGLFISGDKTVIGGTTEADANTAGTGAGIYLYSGQLKMEGGNITGNKAVTVEGDSDSGKIGGVYIGDKFTMDGGTISGNTAYDVNIPNASDYFSKDAGYGTIGSVLIGQAFPSTIDGIGTLCFSQDCSLSNDLIITGPLNLKAASSGVTLDMNTNQVKIRESGDLTIGENLTINSTNPSATVLLEEVNSKLTLNGGTISGNSSGGGVYVTHGTFTMNSGTISGNNKHGVYVAEIFTMKGGTISGNNADGDNKNGGGVHVADGGKFTMEGGTISENHAGTDGSGGGVNVADGGKFTMDDGTITGNWADSGTGGGVHVESGGTFTMNGGVISENLANNSPDNVTGTYSKMGGVISEFKTIPASELNGTYTVNDNICVTGKLSLSDGDKLEITAEDPYVLEFTEPIVIDGCGELTISGSTIVIISHTGRTVKISDGGKLIMQGSSMIRGNYTPGDDDTIAGGGVEVTDDGSSLTMNNDSKITNCYSSTNGGGVLIKNGAKFMMNGGTIVDNMTAKDGGGVYVGEDSTFNMKGGTIGKTDGVTSNASSSNFGNKATGNGGGIYCMGTLNISDSPIISYNIANQGGGIYSDGTTSFKGSYEINYNAACVGNDYKGGGIYLKSGELSLSSGSFNSNIASLGGGIYIDTGAILTTTESSTLSMDGNSSGSYNMDEFRDLGGGLFVKGTANLYGGTIKNGHNTGNSTSGSIYIDESADGYTKGDGCTITCTNQSNNGIKDARSGT